jgi:hypothetical protein
VRDVGARSFQNTHGGGAVSPVGVRHCSREAESPHSCPPVRFDGHGFTMTWLPYHFTFCDVFKDIEIQHRLAAACNAVISSSYPF